MSELAPKSCLNCFHARPLTGSWPAQGSTASCGVPPDMARAVLPGAYRTNSHISAVSIRAEEPFIGCIAWGPKAGKKT